MSHQHPLFIAKLSKCFPEFFDSGNEQELIFEYSENSSKDFVLSSDFAIEDLEGVLEKKGVDDLGWNSAKEKELLVGETDLRTKKDSTALIIFKNGLVIRLNEETQAKIEFEGAKMKVTLIGGELYSRMIGFEKNEYEFNVGTHRLISQNSAFFASRNQERNVWVAVVGGEIDFENGIDGNQRAVSTKKVLTIRSDIGEIRDLSREDVEKEFVAMSIGEGRQQEMVAEFDEKKEEESVEDEKEKLETGDNI